MGDAMSDVERLRQRFIAEFEAGRAPDPREYLAEVSEADQRELETLLDVYLERAPRRRFDQAAFAVSPARELADDLAQTLDGQAGTWPVVLPRLRHSARLRRTELVARLAAALNVPGREEKVGRYYHEMEQGLLEPRGVSDRVLDALGDLLGTTRERLREAAGALTAAPPAARDALFARTATPDPDARAAMGAPPAASPATPPDQRDEVDELFRGG
jgi:hypothetical protein